MARPPDDPPLTRVINLKLSEADHQLLLAIAGPNGTIAEAVRAAIRAYGVLLRLRR